MTDNFKFAQLSSKHKKWFILHQATLFTTVGGLTYAGIKITNPEILTANDQMSLTIGAIVGILIGILAYSNRLKSLIKIKFMAFAIAWVLLYSLQAIMPTLIWTIGLVITPLMVDDLILVPVWNNLWYNNYERQS